MYSVNVQCTVYNVYTPMLHETLYFGPMKPPVHITHAHDTLYFDPMKPPCSHNTHALDTGDQDH